MVPSLQKGGPFRRQPWKTAGKGVTFARGCLPAGIQEPPGAITWAEGMQKKEKTRRNKMSLELSAGCQRCRSSPAGWHFISNPAVSLHSCLQAVWCWRHPRSPVPLALLEGTQADGPGERAGAAPWGQLQGREPRLGTRFLDVRSRSCCPH